MDKNWNTDHLIPNILSVTQSSVDIRDKCSELNTNFVVYF